MDLKRFFLNHIILAQLFSSQILFRCDFIFQMSGMFALNELLSRLGFSWNFVFGGPIFSTNVFLCLCCILSGTNLCFAYVLTCIKKNSY